LGFMPPQASDHGNMANDMRRSGSESDFSQAGDNARNYRDYRVRKSSLIGYVQQNSDTASIEKPSVLVSVSIHTAQTKGSWGQEQEESLSLSQHSFYRLLT
jgi:hypothetical protein